MSHQTRRFRALRSVRPIFDRNARVVSEPALIRLPGAMVLTALFLPQRSIEPRLIICENLLHWRGAWLRLTRCAALAVGARRPGDMVPNPCAPVPPRP